MTFKMLAVLLLLVSTLGAGAEKQTKCTWGDRLTDFPTECIFRDSLMNWNGGLPPSSEGESLILVSRYPITPEIIEKISRQPGVEVVYGVGRYTVRIHVGLLFNPDKVGKLVVRVLMAERIPPKSEARVYDGIPNEGVPK